MLTIGLCGGIGTGKTTVQAAFAACGIPGIDTDLVYHSLIGSPSPLTSALAERFGTEILRPDGSVDRAGLASIVFAEGAEEKRAELNRITHTAVLAECRAWLEEQRRSGAFAAIVNAPLLFESGFDSECDMTVAVLASRDRRIERLFLRNGMPSDEAARRIDAQLDDAFLLSHTDFSIENNGTREELLQRVHVLAEHIKTIAEDCNHGK